MIIRVLRRGDENELDGLLLRHLDSSMFLLSNSRRAGLEYDDAPYHATYVGAYDAGHLVAAAAHCWNGNVVMQGPTSTMAPLIPALLRASRRPLAGFVGPRAQVDAAEASLPVALPEPILDEKEGLYALRLDDLQVPPALAEARVRGRPAEMEDLPTVVPWRVEYEVETLGELRRPELTIAVHREVSRSIQERRLWLLEDESGPLGCTAFNAVLQEAVQVGGVYTPPSCRGRGIARCAVAASLLHARAEGARRGLLFTGDGNLPARRAYAALGFRRIGDFRLLRYGPD